jgi:hypothetical protein
VSSSVAGSFWPESGVSAASDKWSSSLLQGHREREREEEEELEGQSASPVFVRNCVRGQCLRSRTMYTIHE